MTNRPTVEAPPQGPDVTNALKGWMMVALTVVFVALYGAALTGLLRPLADEKMVVRLEPLIFVIIGYYFGRLPAQQNEKTLRDEVARQARKADAAQHAKEQAQQEREALEEKVRNARAVLTSVSAVAPKAASNGGQDETGAPAHEDSARGSVVAALNILNL